MSDFDLIFHRFRNVKDCLGARDVEHLMVVEVKTGNESLEPAQQDTLSVANGLLNSIIPVDGDPILVQSRPGMIRPRERKVVWHGVNLLRVPPQRNNVGPFFWQNQEIDSFTLSKVLSFINDPKYPELKLDIDRRHKGPLFAGA